jgi:Nif-specific regulatory protein
MDSLELQTLLDIGGLLNETPDLKENLCRVLARLSDSMEMIRGTVTILNPERTKIRIEAACGLDPEAIMRGRYDMGEGITGSVIKTGRPMIVPKISAEPLFLDRTAARRTSAARRDYSFICVPIKDSGKVIGSLSVDRVFDRKYDLKHAESFLSIIATMLARNVLNLEEISAEQEKLRKRNRALREKIARKYSMRKIIGRSESMRGVFETIYRLSHSSATVLLRGESGTGKELIAKAIHYDSERAQAPLVIVNCAALPASLVESELFGHEKGAFTGAVALKAGKFERAAGGTIFLDEIGCLDLDSQAKLLRVLQEKEFERVGGTGTIKSGARVIAATNKDLEKAVEDRQFREDLYFRLNVFPVHLPPLRERRDDIIPLAEFFLEKYYPDRKLFLSKEVAAMLLIYHWPGNVRELENSMERAGLLCRGSAIEAVHLPSTLRSDRLAAGGKPLDKLLSDLNRQKIMEALSRTSGNVLQAADLLGIRAHKLYFRLKKLHIDFHTFRRQIQ